MIQLTNFNTGPIYINPLMIVSVTNQPPRFTAIKMADGSSVSVTESLETVIELWQNALA